MINLKLLTTELFGLELCGLRLHGLGYMCQLWLCVKCQIHLINSYAH